MAAQNYKYDVFLSWTGKDRLLKNQVKQSLENAGLVCYDSEVECKGEFRSDYINALQLSKVYLILLTDNLRNNPNVSGYGSLTEVRREVHLAMELESRGELNVILLNFSEFFCYKTTYRDTSDQVGWFFWTETRGFSRTDALDGFTEDVAKKLVNDVRDFVEARNNGKPIISQKPQLGILEIPFADCENFGGRSDEIQQITDAFVGGARAVILSGMGGIGKTSIAKHFAKLCKENGTFVCPQIVRVQCSDEALHGDTYGTVVSSVVYTDDVQYERLTEEKKRSQQERIISNLPEYVVLIVDNFSALSNEEVQIFLQKMKCKLLITTRLHVDDLDEKQVKQICVDKLSPQEALSVFCKSYGQVVDMQDFAKLYDIVSGHTITLCLVAKAMKAHKMSLDKILEELNSTGEISENVVHIDGGDNKTNQTVSSHLYKLFSIAGFENDEGCKAVLRNLSVIADGKLPCELLCNELGFSNRNQLNRLAEFGWITFENDGDEYAFLHPVLSLIANKLLVPTRQSAQVAVKYLCKKAQMRNYATYKNLGFVCESLSRALYRLAQNEGLLCQPLWDQFTILCRLVSDVDAVKESCGKLVQVLKNSAEKSKVQMYADMYLLERYPTKVDIIAPYLNNLKNSADDYKFVLRALSITGDYLLPFKANHKALAQIYNKALDAAIEKDDKFSISFLSTCALVDTSGEARKKISKYLSKHKRDKDGSLLLLKQSVYAAAVVKDFSIYESLDSTEKSMGNVGFQMLVKHPLASVRMFKTVRQFAELDKKDDLYTYGQLLNLISDKIKNEFTIDPESLVQAFQELYLLQWKHEITLQDFSNVLHKAICIIKKMPIETQDVLQQIVDANILNIKNFTVEQYANARVAFEISCLLGYESSIEKALNLLEAQRSLHSDDHYEVVELRIKLASQYAFFKKTQAAINEYNKVIKILKKSAPKSQKLFEVCNAMLSLASSISLTSDGWSEFLSDVYSTGAECCEKYSNEELTIRLNYIGCLQKLKQNSDVAQTISNQLEAVVADYKKYSENNLSAHTNILMALNNMCVTQANAHRFEQAEAISQLMRRLGKQTKVAKEKKNVRLCVLAKEAYIALHKGEGNKVLYEKVVAFGVKHHCNFGSNTSGALWLEFSLLKKDERCKNASGFAFENFIAAFFGEKCRLSSKEKTLVENMWSCIPTCCSDEVSEKQHALNILMYYGDRYCENTYSKNFYINVKDWRKCKSVKRYKLLLLDKFWEVFGDWHSQEIADSWKVERQERDGKHYFVYSFEPKKETFWVATNPVEAIEASVQPNATDAPQ